MKYIKWETIKLSCVQLNNVKATRNVKVSEVNSSNLEMFCAFACKINETFVLTINKVAQAVRAYKHKRISYGYSDNPLTFFSVLIRSEGRDQIVTRLSSLKLKAADEKKKCAIPVERNSQAKFPSEKR